MELFTNNGASALNGAINNSVTALIVDSAATFPTAGNFRIRVENEIMLVTAVSTNTFTVVRAQEGTAAASHADDIAVREVLTAGVMTNAQVWDEILTKSGDTGRSGTSATDDPHLVSAGTYASGEVIEFEAFLIVDGTSATADIRLQFASSQNMLGYGVWEGSDTTANAVLSAAIRVSGATSFVGNAGTSNGRAVFRVRGMISFQAGSASFSFQWSTVNGGSTVTVKAGSKLYIRRHGVI